MPRPRRSGISGDRALWALAVLAAGIRSLLAVAACRSAASLTGLLRTRSVHGIWSAAPGSLVSLAVVMLATAAATRSLTVLLRTARAEHMLWRRLAGAAVPAPDRLPLLPGLLAERVRVVADPAPFAFTHGLLRPRIVLSTGLLPRLGEEELRTVLTHELDHVRGRDPLKAAVVRILAGRAFYLSVVRDLADRFTAGRELAADRAPVTACGRRALAAALLTCVEAPAWAASASALASDVLLNARITQLETAAEPAPSRVPPRRLAATLLVATTLVSALAAVPGPHCADAGRTGATASR